MSNTRDTSVFNDSHNPSDAIEEGEIILKPSTELIPDEYEHNDNRNAAIYIFKSASIKSRKCENKFVDTMQLLNYDIPRKNIHTLDNRDEVVETINQIAQCCQNANMLILLFIGFFDDDPQKNVFKLSLTESIQFTEIWSRFTTEKCPELKSKPKVFLFQTQKFRSSAVVDKMLRLSQKAFDMPVESDMLIVYNKIDGRESRFLETFCDNVTKYGTMEDIISLLTYTNAQHEFQPIIISTMTRKMYLTASTARGHHFETVETHSALEKKLKDAQARLEQIRDELRKPSGALGRIRSFLSPRSSRDRSRATSPVKEHRGTRNGNAPTSDSSMGDEKNLPAVKPGRPSKSDASTATPPLTPTTPTTPTQIPPTQIPPTQIPPTQIPPTQIPPTYSISRARRTSSSTTPKPRWR